MEMNEDGGDIGRHSSVHKQGEIEVKEARNGLEYQVGLYLVVISYAIATITDPIEHQSN